jgi:hypothetical protein
VRWSRREFLAAGLAAPVVASLGAGQRTGIRVGRRAIRRDGSSPLPNASVFRSLGARLAHVPGLRRHFIFEYYPWYGTSPWMHWDENFRAPPLDIAAAAVPLLGPYDSADVRVIEQHARWIAEAGVGAVNLSWWGQGDPTDRRAPVIMDVMRDHDIRVTFHIEPYTANRAAAYPDDIQYLVREYGDRRGWDALLVLEHPDGSVGPVFKTFGTILPPVSIDCLGVVRPVTDFVPDGSWRQATDRLRTDLAREFSAPLLLCDSLDEARVQAAGFDGVSLYDPFVRPFEWPEYAARFSAQGLLYAFNVNVGFDKYPSRDAPGPCFRPTPFEPPLPSPLDWSQAASRDAARLAGEARITESLQANLVLQTESGTTNASRGMFLTYINSFNEWHEGTAFEPARDFADLSAAERQIGYHNPDDGRWRLDLLKAALDEVFAGAEDARRLLADGPVAV